MAPLSGSKAPSEPTLRKGGWITGADETRQDETGRDTSSFSHSLTHTLKPESRGLCGAAEPGIRRHLAKERERREGRVGGGGGREGQKGKKKKNERRTLSP